jgi:hypothetical protein
MKKQILLASVLVLGACGKSGGGSNGTPVAPGGDPGSGGDDAEGKDGFYKALLDLNDKPIPVTKIPSILEDGKFVDVCREGQSMHLDECYDEVHFSERPGFKVTKTGKEQSEYGYLSPGWLGSFAERDQQNNIEFVLRHRKTFKCIEWCPSPTFYGSYGGSPDVYVELDSTGYKFASHTTMYTYFSFGGRYAKPEHIWLLNGTLTLKGKELRLPITRRQIKEVYPEMADDRITTEFGDIQFAWEDEALGFKNVPVNEDDKHLVMIDYETIREENADVQPDTN